MRSDAVKTGMQQAPHRSLFNALGMTKEEMERPLVGIVSSYNEIVPGHMNLDKIVNAVKHQTVLNRAGKRIRDIDLFGSGANRKQPLRLLGKHRKHAKGIISLPRYVHVSPFKEYEQLERAPGPSLCRDAK